MPRDYWDINDIITYDETFDVRLLVQAPGLGHLDPLRASMGSRDLPRGTVLNLPLWMVVPMARIGLVEPLLPDRYGVGMQSVLRKGSEGARLADKSLHYFEVGVILGGLLPDSQELTVSVFHGILHRIRFIIDRSCHSQRNEEREGEFVHLFTESELSIYLAGTRANEEFDQWRNGSLWELKPRPELVSLLQEVSIEN